ncbi:MULTISPECIES: CRISPR-associated protein Cas4 [unclassified Clostridium]|uniref:CRISPR-associated protein Cas4 n=1 Tax=unclassified Clostridium TaxID=2614128 RepID=UPI0013EE9132|nr:MULTISPECIES: CRISPR-associated protein Cas4 [unclassified Clostridium]MBZ9691142.1 CRISPR-associated protein Cas4 [Clostridium sp. M14]NFG61522.1 CRISPR-associated protein Cas4 [Clostridium botulinum]NFQ10683.1 CRISPR-associated protein Cas4 [Clostridium botulinum]
MYKPISGTMIYYYIVCKRKLWYFYHEIQMEVENENVQIGKVIDETTYAREEKHINIDDVISIDYIKNKGILHEIKKSRKIEEAGIMQIKYYLYYLKQKGVEGIKGKVDYPLLKQSIDIELTEDDEKNIDELIIDLKQIVSMTIPPVLDKKKICKSCAYFELCYI